MPRVRDQNLGKLRGRHGKKPDDRACSGREGASICMVERTVAERVAIG